MRDDAQEFRRRMANSGRQVPPQRNQDGRGMPGRSAYARNDANYRQGYRDGRRINSRQAPERRYVVKKGTAYRAREKAKKQALKMKLKVGAMLLAAGVGIGGFTYASAQDKTPETTITQLQNMGYDSQSLGMSQETVEKMEKYDDFFERFSNADKGQLTITDNEIIEKLHEIEELNSTVIQEKMARLEGTSRKNVSIDYGNSSDIGEYASISIDKDGKEIVYNNNNGVFLGLGKENNIPDEMVDLIFQLDEYAGLEEELKTDSISKYNAIAEMKKLYGNISGLATKTLLRDEKGNISLMNYIAKDNTLENNREEEKEM